MMALLRRRPDSKYKENEETSGFSGKHHSSGFNIVLTCGFNAMLVYLSRTVPGNWHDMRIMKENPIDLGLWHMNGEPHNEESAKVMALLENLVDKGFKGIAKYYYHLMWNVPHIGKNKKSPKELVEAYKSKNKARIAAALGLTVQQLIENQQHSSRRSLVERVIGKLKRWTVLVGPFRGTASQLNRQYDILGGIWNLDKLWHEIKRDEGSIIDSLMEKRYQYIKKR